jgi:acetyl-CoA carboxylase biotin carboxyl carrier protein
MDIKHLKNLVALMVENDLAEIELNEGETHILLRRGHPPTINNAPVMMSMPANPGAATGGAPAADARPAEPVSKDLIIRSPMVGTFYTAADPESPPFVKVGDVLEPDTVVCLVEAMKVFNEIKAEVSGRLTKILVSNAAAVEFDQPLFAVEPN